MKGLRNLIILVVLGWIGWAAFLQREPGDQPEILISNGPVRLEAQPDRQHRRGTFDKSRFSLDRSWYYHHPAQGPRRFDVVVRNSTCGDEARYTAEELRVLSSGIGVSSTVTISISGFAMITALTVDPQSDAPLVHDPSRPFELAIGRPDDQLTSVTVAGTTCAFSAGEGSITITPRH